MLKKFLDGMVFGAGFTLAFIVIWVISIYFLLPKVLNGEFGKSISSRNESIVNEVPHIEEPKRFLGSPAIYSGGFMDNQNGVLASGPGEIIGSALVNSVPVEGLRLRLALNGSVMSQWATTNANGIYTINVPYGTYKIDGFELDTNTANKVLPNKINQPNFPHSSGKFGVSMNNYGHGLNFKFVDPVIKKLQKNKYSIRDEIVLEWDPYPNAVEYLIQISEKTEPNTWRSKSLFSWPEKPTVSDTEFRMNSNIIQLNPGHFYRYDVEAKNKNGEIISETVRDMMGYDFETVE